MNMLLKKIYVDKFRNLRDFDFTVGRKLTVISGHNGVGKSNLLSLIASGSGTKAFKPSNSSSFHPEFIEFFHINNEELNNEYKVYLEYTYSNTDINNYKFYKRLSLKNDNKTERGIRIIPRASNYSIENINLKDIAQEVKTITGIGPDARVQIPTMFLSLSRLYPLGETKVKVNKNTAKSTIMQSNANEKYKEWYNRVLYNSIKNDTTELITIEKDINKAKILHMEIQGTPLYSQSVGQDSLGSIISSLVEFYLIHQSDEYLGGVLCIDEIDVSLHPDAQIRLFDLLNQLSFDLNLQIIMSTHSLTIIQEILKKQNRNNEDYNLAYLKDTLSPYVMSNPTYLSIKSDLFLKSNPVLPKLNIYFEDEVAKRIYTNLLSAALKIYIENSQLEEIKNINLINSDCNLIDAFLGCDVLLKLPDKDEYFKKVCIILDGDARTNIQIEDTELKNYLDKKYNPGGRNNNLNIIYLPTYFFPEFYVYRIIWNFTNSIENQDFWRSLDNREETRFYTRQYISQYILMDPQKLSRESIKNRKSEMFEFIEKTDLLYHYYKNPDNFSELNNFIESLYKSIDILKKKLYSEK